LSHSTAGTLNVALTPEIVACHTVTDGDVHNSKNTFDPTGHGVANRVTGSL
jgi:hypothetical protein